MVGEGMSENSVNDNTPKKKADKKKVMWIHLGNFSIYSPWFYPANGQIYEYNYVSPDNRVELWMRDRVRRLTQKKNKVE